MKFCSSFFTIFVATAAEFVDLINVIYRPTQPDPNVTIKVPPTEFQPAKSNDCVSLLESLTIKRNFSFYFDVTAVLQRLQ